VINVNLHRRHPMLNWIQHRNRYIRAKAYRIACTEAGFVKVKKHDSWADAAGYPDQYYIVSEKHPDFDKVYFHEIKRLRNILANT